MAPTVGLYAAATGVSFRTGSFTTSGERVALGLVLRFGSLDCVTDNAACFADAFPEGGSIIHFGDHRVDFAVIPEEYPSEVLTFSDPPPVSSGGCSSSISSCVRADTTRERPTAGA